MLKKIVKKILNLFFREKIFWWNKFVVEKNGEETQKNEIFFVNTKLSFKNLKK